MQISTAGNEGQKAMSNLNYPLLCQHAISLSYYSSFLQKKKKKIIDKKIPKLKARGFHRNTLNEFSVKMRRIEPAGSNEK